MSYTPEPTHPIDEITLPAQLDREFWALSQDRDIITDYMVGAMPHKAFNVILAGQGVIGDDPNLPVPIINDSYNIDLSFGTNGVNHSSLGVYEFRLQFAQIGGINILDVTYPSFIFDVDFPANAITRAGPTRTSFDESFSIRVASAPLGLFSFETEHIYSTGGGALSVELTDMQPNDVMIAFGVLNLRGNARDYAETP